VLPKSLSLQRFHEGQPVAIEPAVAREALRRLAVEPDEVGAADIYAGDGGEATLDLSRLRAGGTANDIPVRLTVFSRGVADLIHLFATVTGMTVAATGSHRLYLTEGSQHRHLPTGRGEDAHTCVDGDELHWWLVRDATHGDESPPQPRSGPVTRGDALRSVFGLFRRD
jgi:hypothetical protein